MSASESSPIAANLQESIEQLIAETVRRSQNEHEEELQAMRGALKQALEEIESGQAAMTRASEILRTALDAPAPEAPSPSPDGEDEEEVAEAPVAAEAAEPVPVEAEIAKPVAEPHELDVIAHDVSINIATGLQSMLRKRDEVISAQTREFVNGELRLRLEMKTGLEMDSFKEWVAEHGGRITTQTGSVIELHFGE